MMEKDEQRSNILVLQHRSTYVHNFLITEIICQTVPHTLPTPPSPSLYHFTPLSLRTVRTLVLPRFLLDSSSPSSCNSLPDITTPAHSPDTGHALASPADNEANQGIE